MLSRGTKGGYFVANRRLKKGNMFSEIIQLRVTTVGGCNNKFLIFLTMTFR